MILNILILEKHRGLFIRIHVILIIIPGANLGDIRADRSMLLVKICTQPIYFQNIAHME